MAGQVEEAQVFVLGGPGTYYFEYNRSSIGRPVRICLFAFVPRQDGLWAAAFRRADDLRIARQRRNVDTAVCRKYRSSLQNKAAALLSKFIRNTIPRMNQQERDAQATGLRPAIKSGSIESRTRKNEGFRCQRHLYPDEIFSLQPR